MERLQIIWHSYRLVIVGGIVAVIAAGGWLMQQPPKPAVSASVEPPAPAEIVVDIEGAVVGPGVRRLPENALIEDALTSAGGLADYADLPRVAKELNRAEKLKPNQKIYIPTIGEKAAQAALGNGEEAGAGELININTASQAELEKLPGVGPSTAKKIMSYRDDHGFFGSVEELMEVPGIGQATFDKLADQITI